MRLRDRLRRLRCKMQATAVAATTISFSTIVSTFTFSSTVAASATAAVAHGMDGRHPVA